LKPSPTNFPKSSKQGMVFSYIVIGRKSLIEIFVTVLGYSLFITELARVS
jgi:hypothetical protein